MSVPLRMASAMAQTIRAKVSAHKDHASQLRGVRLPILPILHLGLCSSIVNGRGQPIDVFSDHILHRYLYAEGIVVALLSCPQLWHSPLRQHIVRTIYSCPGGTYLS